MKGCKILTVADDIIVHVNCEIVGNKISVALARLSVH